jgi:hypothetical protein
LRGCTVNCLACGRSTKSAWIGDLLLSWVELDCPSDGPAWSGSDCAPQGANSQTNSNADKAREIRISIIGLLESRSKRLMFRACTRPIRQAPQIAWARQNA